MAKKPTGQMAKAKESTGKMTVGFAPEISDAAWKNVARKECSFLKRQTM
ncbi:hypothetical protein [Amycolatopsis sp. WAC 01375]|nr:hypothetical protein [Amycolatopsis sp. WAC 01375]